MSVIKSAGLGLGLGLGLALNSICGHVAIVFVRAKYCLMHYHWLMQTMAKLAKLVFQLVLKHGQLMCDIISSSDFQSKSNMSWTAADCFSFFLCVHVFIIFVTFCAYTAN